MDRAEARRFALRQRLDRAERRAGLSVSLLTTLVASGALALGITAAQAGDLTPAMGAMAFFATLALAEVLVPLRRALAELGRMTDAARRVGRDVGRGPARAVSATANAAPSEGCLAVRNLSLARPGSRALLVRDLSFTLAPQETLALTGPSGCGKSTVLLALAGLHDPASGQITLDGRNVETLSEASLRDAMTLLPQRSALMAGSVAQALTLSADLPEDMLWSALRAVQLDKVIGAKGGLSAPLGPRGAGLSGGEARRLTLARALLRQPKVLLLDEPTEGLDEATSRAVLAGIRAYLPQAAILVAAHRRAEIEVADRVLALG